MTLTKRKKRFLIFFAVLGIIIAIAAWWINGQLEPNKLTRTVLGKLGQELNLQFDFKGEPSYAMKPEPRLIIPNLDVRNPADKEIIFSAERIEISLPWSTIMGDTPHITRIEASTPFIDLPKLLAWQSTRPAGKPFEVPTFTKGLKISNGKLKDIGYGIENIELELPHLENQQPIDANIAANIVIDKTVIGIAGLLNIEKAGLASAIKLQSKHVLKFDKDSYPYSLSLVGDYNASDSKKIELNASSLRWKSQAPLPDIDSNLQLSIAENILSLKSQGKIAQWLKEWPVLPSPLNKQTKDIPFTVAYSGKFNFSDAFKLQLQLQKSQFASELKIAELQHWVAGNDGSPLPPLKGAFNTPKIELEGVSLEGVSVEIIPDP
jgi:uncharacterized protein involved in outer membrane biogenesis